MDHENGKKYQNTSQQGLGDNVDKDIKIIWILI